jgi:hypothetical protein
MDNRANITAILANTTAPGKVRRFRLEMNANCVATTTCVGHGMITAITMPEAGRQATRQEARSGEDLTQAVQFCGPESPGTKHAGAETFCMSSLPAARTAQKLEPECPAATDGAIDLEPIRTAMKGIRFGEVRIVIQDGVVIHIDRVEKNRIR